MKKRFIYAQLHLFNVAPAKVKRSAALLVFILFYLCAQADYWTQKANFGGSARYGAAGFSIGTKGYIGTGENLTGLMFSDFWEYNRITNIWTQKADFSGTLRIKATGFSIGAKGYMGTGYNWNGGNYLALNDFWEYDPVTNIWTQKADIGTTGRFYSVSFSIANKGYIGTGMSLANYLKDFWEYDPTVNTWTQKANFGGLKKALAVAFSNGNTGYIGTGTNYSTYPFGKIDFWGYNPSTNVWTQKANFAGTARTEACAFWICPFGYLGSGTTEIGVGTVADFWKYDIANNTWTQVANFGPGTREMAVSFSIGDKGYIGTGMVADGFNIKNDFWEYTPDSACATGMEELSTSNFQFSISPNPAKDFIVITSSLSVNEKINITIADVKGKKIYQKPLTPKGEPTINIPLLELKAGIYIVELSNGKEKAVKKFVKE
jgi:DNA-binding transcriptional regulator of glucitol operon